jgi:hypothetical protein
MQVGEIRRARREGAAGRPHMRTHLRHHPTLAGALRALVVAACVGLSATPALAIDVMRVEVQFLDAARGDSSQHALLTIAPRMLRIDQYTNLKHRAAHTLIYRGDRDVIYSIDPEDRQYIAVDRSLIAAFGLELQAARREMETVMRRLPDDQRKSGERIVGLETQEDDGKVRAALWVRDEGTTVKRLGRACRRVTLWRADVNVAAGCVVPWESMGIGPRDLDVFRQLANFQREIMGAGGLTPLEVVPDQPLDILVQLDGFPLELSRSRGGKLVSAILVTQAAKMRVPADTFDIPRDYAVRPGFEFLIGDMGELPEASPAPARPAPRR